MPPFTLELNLFPYREEYCYLLHFESVEAVVEMTFFNGFKGFLHALESVEDGGGVEDEVGANYGENGHFGTPLELI